MKRIIIDGMILEQCVVHGQEMLGIMIHGRGREYTQYALIKRGLDTFKVANEKIIQS